MRLVTTPEAEAFIRERGGRVFVWPLDLEGPAAVFALEASTESPGVERGFVVFGAGGFEVLFDPQDHGVPDELHLAVKGWRTKRIRAYWNGHSYGRD